MLIADQVHDKISGLVMNQLAFSFGGHLPDDVNDKLYDIVTTKVTYEAEIQKVLGTHSSMLGYGNLMQLAEKITLECLFSTDDNMYIDDVAEYIEKFPEEKAKWLAHLMTFLD